MIINNQIFKLNQYITNRAGCVNNLNLEVLKFYNQATVVYSDFLYIHFIFSAVSCNQIYSGYLPKFC